MSQANNRYEYIDFLRGVSSIGIIAIHSAFWGGAKLHSRMVLEYYTLFGRPLFLLFVRLGSQFPQKRCSEDL